MTIFRLSTSPSSPPREKNATKRAVSFLNSQDRQNITVLHMEVPCCAGLLHMAKQAIGSSGRDIPLEGVTIGIKGDLKPDSP